MDSECWKQQGLPYIVNKYQGKLSMFFSNHFVCIKCIVDTKSKTYRKYNGTRWHNACGAQSATKIHLQNSTSLSLPWNPDPGS